MADPPPQLKELIAQAQDLGPLYWNRTGFGEVPCEDELIAHFIVPLLRAFSWPPELIAVQWRKVDVCLFRALPRTPENCYLIVEAKRFGEGIENALGQAKAYLGSLGVRRDIIVTDGIRYRLYDADKDFAEVAYANLLHLKQPALNLFSRLERASGVV